MLAPFSSVSSCGDKMAMTVPASWPLRLLYNRKGREPSSLVVEPKAQTDYDWPVFGQVTIPEPTRDCDSLVVPTFSGTQDKISLTGVLWTEKKRVNT